MDERRYLQGKKVLLVDDEPDVLETLEDLLEECDTTTADGFEAAKRLLESRSFDVAVLDIMGVRGYDLLKIAVEKKVIAVMLTARAVEPRYIVKSFKEGAAFYIPKEEMGNIALYLNDVLEALENNKSPWDRWFERMGAYCERTFGSRWRDDDREIWEKLPFY